MAKWVDEICEYCNKKGLPACICGNVVTVWDNIVGEHKVEFEYTTFADAVAKIETIIF